MASWFVKLLPSIDNGNPMGNGASTSSSDEIGSSFNSAPNPTPGKLVTDSLYELYAPKAGDPEIEIIFFHGLQAGDYSGAYWKTWSSDNRTAWPQTLLGSAFKKARILSVSYDSSARKTSTSGTSDLDSIAENLISDIIDCEPKRGDRPIILVGHSLGCLVIKHLLLSAHDKSLEYNVEMFQGKIDKIKSFMNNLRGVFFYSPPNAGSKLADWAGNLPIPGKSEVLLLLTTLNKDVARLNNQFRSFRDINKIPVHTLGEAFETKRWGISQVIVPEASARQDTDDYYTVKADHIDVCKPKTATESSFSKLQSFVKDNVQKTHPNLLQVDELV